jgi:putative heme-binding domain-containing protein
MRLPLRWLARSGSLLVLLALLLVTLLGPGDRPLRSADREQSHTRLVLFKGDRITLVGNALAERMQHDGWLETYLHSRFPTHDLVVRNQGFSGDEIGGFTDRPDFNKRLRSAAFGSADTWLTFNKTDVVFAFFGYNESFADKAGLAAFRKDLEAFIDNARAKKYNGRVAPRIVLFSPIAHEDLKNPNLPDGTANNRRLALYTAALAEVAHAKKVSFVDLYHPTLALYGKVGQPLTINGVHLNENGNEEVAKIIDQALFAGPPAGKRDPASLAGLRQAVRDRNFYWFHRYRTTDGYSVYGGRSHLRFVDGQTNREVAMREMEVLDVMAANRDKRIWAVARGGDAPVDDSNTPAFIPVRTNKPGDLPGGKHRFLDPEKAIDKMTVARGMKVNLFASEKEFPLLAKPVQMAWDTKGRLWVAVWPSYPHWKPRDQMDDKILVFEDTTGTGRADKCTVFADKLHCPTGFEFYNGGVLVAQAPDLMFLKDTKGTGKADLRVRVLGGLDSADTHHTSNSFALDGGGGLYFQEGTFHHSQVETPYGPPVRCANAGVFRYEPRTHKFDTYVTFGFANPHGHVFDRWGRDIVIDGTGSNPYDSALFSGHLPYPQKHQRPPMVWNPPSRPCPAVETLSSRHFPQEMQGNVLVPNVIGFQGIFQFKLQDKGASFTGTQAESILSSTDPNFRPSDVKIGPDGAIYFLDWHNPIIGHMQHNLRDPSRDQTHGRIYRITYPSRPLLKSPKVAGETIDKLLELFREPEDRVRYRARIELAARPSDQVIAAAKKWLAGLDTSAGDYEHLLLEGLWLHQSHNRVDGKLLERMLTAKDARARAAGTRVLSYWHDRVPGALDLLRKLAADNHPRVRLEAVRAASFFTQPEAIEIVLIADEKPKDQYLQFVRGETLRALEPVVKKAIAEGRKIQFTTPTGMRYFVRTVSTEDLLKMERTPGVYLELLFRPAVRDEYRKEALTGLARQQKKGETRVLVDAIVQHDADTTSQNDSVAFDLARLLTSKPDALAREGVRADLQKLALSGRQPTIRQLGFVALVAADGGADKAWALAVKSPASLRDFVESVPLIGDASHRAALYPKVAALLAGLPKELAGGKEKKGPVGRFVRIELPGRRKTLTLAEVEVYCDGVNVARKGKASQKNTAYGGTASKAIDGNTSGNWGEGGQTHTQENTSNPWWQVDLGAGYPIQQVVVYNRTDGGLGKRLSGFTLKVLGADGQVVFQKDKNPSPAVKAVFELGSASPERLVRQAAMQALPTMRGHEADAVKALAKFLRDDQERRPAVAALQRIPARLWPSADVRPVLDDILAYVRKVPVKNRTTPAVVDALQLADNLAAQLPLTEARKVRKELGELGVRVLRLGTLVEQMLYDRERLVVQAGKPFEVLFENTDVMPHNLVFVEPGALEEVGDLAEKTGNDPKAMQRQYVPPSRKVLKASTLLQPRQTERIAWTAPAKPGVYPYVCTFPGHWRRMHGALYVVDDLEAYQADPENYLKKNPVPIADKLLEFNRPRKEWKFDELAPAVKMLAGRSFATGKQLFTVASCVSCHKLQGVGQEFGPGLTKLDPKTFTSTAEVLRHILEPSLKIDDKYRNWTFELNNGQVKTGMILKETPAEIELIENPLAATTPVKIRTARIDKRTKSDVSPMPKGLLDKLTREEILDLLAYVIAGGNAKHKVFQGGGHEHHGH